MFVRYHARGGRRAAAGLLVLALGCATRPSGPPPLLEPGRTLAQAAPAIEKALTCRKERNDKQACTKLDCKLEDGGILYAFGDRGGMLWSSRVRELPAAQADAPWETLRAQAKSRLGEPRTCGLPGEGDCWEWQGSQGRYMLLRLPGPAKVHILESTGDMTSVECRPETRNLAP